jgi:DNA-binding SARP family transcriptional activator/tetratricopeptide (TPR) repeat protein
MRFSLLGPLAVTDGAGGRATIAGPRLRVLLAALLLHANIPVPAGELAEMVWDGSPPSGAVATLRSYVMRLRRALDSESARITASDPGYVIRVEQAELDVLEFEALCRDARAALRGSEWADASAAAARALRLWRAAPLLDVPAEALHGEFVPRLERLRLQALEDRFDAGLRLGHHQELIPELLDMTVRHPLQERFHAQLMLALAGTGRRAQVLDAYQEARRVLVGELGIEPGQELRDIHQQILADDAAQMRKPPAPAAHLAGRAAELTELTADGHLRVVPRMLPGGIPHFTGRSAELAALSEILAQAGSRAPGTVVISAIGGTAGVGKTALAVNWAHQIAERFGDGQLYVNLRGFDLSGVRVTPAEAICGFLDALGVPPSRIPQDLPAQAGLYRSLLAGRHMLIVLDNARDEDQVRPLLPASPASLVLVTSRNQLTGLAAADGARLMSLDVLTHGEAVQLLSARIGAGRAAAEPGATDEIAALCARLPLALAIAAARAAARPRFPLTQMAAELRDSAGRLDVLDTGDPAASVRAAFSWSYSQLSEQAARMFRLLGLHPGPDISVPAAASLAAAGEPQARRLLGELTRHCLISEHAPGRYAFHDLLRAYAASQARECDPESDRDAAASRILDHYLHTANHGRALLRRPEQEPLALAPPAPGTRPERPADHRQALAWFTAEHQVLLAIVTMAAETGTDRRAWQLPCAMAEYFRRRGCPQDQLTVMAAALAAATRLDDPLGQAMSLRRLGVARYSTGDYDQARAHLEHCLPLYQRLGDRKGEATAQLNLSFPAEAQGRYADALRHNELARGLSQSIGDEPAEAEALANVGWFYALLGDYQQARTSCEQALALTAKHGGSTFEHSIRDTLGYVEHHLGNFAQAAADFESALALSRHHSDAPLQALILIHLGDARRAAGELPQARHAWQQALAIYDDIQHPDADKVRAKLASTQK